MLSLAEVARRNPNGVALIDGTQRFTFGELFDLSERLAQRLELRQGVHPAGALLANNDVTTIALLFALLDRHITTLPVNPRLTSVEQRLLVDKARARWLGSSECGFSDHATPRLEPSADTTGISQPQLLVATSGSSGVPKLVRLSHQALEASAIASLLHLQMTSRDRWLLSLNLAHIGGISILLRCLRAEASVVRAAPAMAASALAMTIEQSEATLASLVPTQLARMLALEPIPRPGSLRAILVGGAHCPLPLAQRARQLGFPVLLTYGLSEAASQVATQPLTDLCSEQVLQDVGHALPNLEVKVEHGVIHVRGVSLFDGYHGEARPPFDTSGWFETGDLGWINSDGRLVTLGRCDDIIVTGGEKVSALEVEAVLATQPWIQAAAVVGLPDAVWGQIVAAAIVINEGTNNNVANGTRLDRELRVLDANLGELLAPHKRPRRWLQVEDLPLLPSGKLDRRAVRTLFERDRGSSTA